MKNIRMVKRSAIIFAFVCVFCILAISLTAGVSSFHECTGGDCLICSYMATRDRILDGLIMIGALCCVALVILTSDICENIFEDTRAQSWTPVCLKVKLSN